ncbi:MAG: HK97 family phage prohead protease [Candidatus Nanopelagicales bacterium]
MATKACSVSVKAGEADGLDEGQFEAYASVFGNKDLVGDIVVKGAFAQSLKEWDERDAVIPLLFGHRIDDPDYNIGSVVKAVEDEHGLKVTGVLDLDNPKAAQVYRLLKGRRIDQMSFAYDILDGAETKAGYELRELALKEVSVVPLGANPQTEVLTVKSTDGDVPVDDDAVEALRAAHAAIGNFLDSVGSEESDDVEDSEEATATLDAKDESSAKSESVEDATACSKALELEIELSE